MSAQVGVAGTSKVGSNCFVAGQVGVADHITIGDRVKIGSKSGIDKSVGNDEIRFGYPALPGIQYHRSFAVFRQLPEMSQKLRELEKRIAKIEE
jgi:UDP-3-O-[3-hydroxymyristoyl] glucosamine N-acyltransferase